MSHRREDRPRPPRSLRPADSDPAPDPEEPGSGGGEGAPEPSPDGEQGSSKPTSVWDVVGEARTPVEDVEFPGRAFEVDGRAWWVQELGRTISGRPEDAGAPLILVGFRREEAPADDPEAREEGGWEREGWVRHASLEDLSHAELAELLARAGPFRPIPDEPRPFFGRRARRGRSGGRRGRR